MSRLAFRDAGRDGVATVCDVWNANEPLLKRDPVVIAHSDAVDPDSAPRRELVIADGEVVGATTVWHPRHTTEIFDVWAALLPGAHAPELEAALFDRVEARARAGGARRITSGSTTNQPRRADFLRRRGYRLLEAGNVSALDLRRGTLNREADRVATDLAAAGIQLTTLAVRPALAEAAHRVYATTQQDIPAAVPISSPALDQWLKMLDAPWFGRDRLWMAVMGGAPVALTLLVHEPVTGMVWTAMTGVLRSHRGRGLAHAVKLRSLAQAAQAGARRVLTYNDERNHPMLAVNRRLGYSVVAQELRHYIDL